jgi:hypothetical protein
MCSYHFSGELLANNIQPSRLCTLEFNNYYRCSANPVSYKKYHPSCTTNTLSGRRRDASSAPSSSSAMETLKASVQLWVFSML